MQYRPKEISGDFFGTHLLINIKNFRQFDVVFDNRQITKHFEKYQSLLTILTKKHGGFFIKNEVDFCEIIFLPPKTPSFRYPLNVIIFARELLEETREFNTYLNNEYHRNFTELERRMLMFREKEPMPEDMLLEIQIVANCSNPNSREHKDKLSRFVFENDEIHADYYHGGVCLNNRALLRNLNGCGIFVGTNLKNFPDFPIESYETISSPNSDGYEKISSFNAFPRFFEDENHRRTFLDLLPEDFFQLEKQPIGMFDLEISPQQIRKTKFNFRFRDQFEKKPSTILVRGALACLLAQKSGKSTEDSLATGQYLFLEGLRNSQALEIPGYEMFSDSEIIKDSEQIDRIKEIEKRISANQDTWLKEILSLTEEIFERPSPGRLPVITRSRLAEVEQKTSDPNISQAFKHLFS